MNIRVLLAGSDINYISRLSDIMSRTSPSMGDVLEITLFTDKDKMKATLEGKKGVARTKYHVALIDESMADSLGDLGQGVSVVVVLTDDTSKDGASGANSGFELADLCIYKFQQVSSIVKKLMTAFVLKRDGTETKKTGYMCAFYSSAGGLGTSTVAAAFAMAATKAGIRPLYVSFEPFNSTEAFFQETSPTNQGLQDVFAYKQDGGMTTAIDIMKAKDSSGVLFLKRFAMRSQIAQLDPSDVATFVEAAKGTEEIDIVVLDLGYGPIGFTERALECADEIFIIGSNHPVAQLKLADLLDKEAFIHQECLGKTHIIYNRTQEPKEDYGCKSVTHIPEVAGATPAAVAASATGYVSGLVKLSWKELG